MSFADFTDEVPVDERQALIDNMNKLRNFSVEESVFYRKYQELKSSYIKYADAARTVKAKIWTPTDINNKELTIQELRDMKPTVIYVEPTDESLMNEWLMLRVFGHSLEYDQNPGRFLRFLIIDANAQEDQWGFPQPKYLGAISVVSDAILLGPREDYLGWTMEDRMQKNKLRHSAIGSCIMPTQPFGYNFIGGKLIACLTAGKVVQDTWKRLYNETLVGVTTTSLYGTGSMYDGMPKFWTGVGETAGKMAIKLDDAMYEVWSDYIKRHDPVKFKEQMTQKNGATGPVTSAKQRIIALIFQHVGIKVSEFRHGFKRGVYYALLYKNGKEFFQSKITEDQLIKKDQWIDDSIAIEWWRAKAIRRYEKLHAEGRLKPEILFYNTMMNMTYEDAKETYFADVGR